MNDGQAQQIVDAIRAHTRAMVAAYIAFTPPDTWSSREQAMSASVEGTDALLAALSAGSGGDGQSESQVANAKPGREPGQGSKEAATPSLPTDLVAARARIAELEAQVKQMRDFATFGGWAFEEYWSDGEPGDIDAGDAQEKAIECGLLGRTSEVDPNATHAEGCDYSPVASASECCCFIPTRRPLIGCAK